MSERLPSHNVPLLLVVDVAIFINHSGLIELDKLKSFTGKSEAYIRSSIAICRMLNIFDDSNLVNPIINSLGKTPNKESKMEVIRKFVQEYEPFLTFIQYSLNDAGLDESARKVYISYSLIGKDYRFLKDLFLSWGVAVGIFTLSDNKLELGNIIKSQVTKINKLDFRLDDDMAIRIHIGNVLGADIFSTLSPAEIEELVDSYKKSETDARGSIECAGRAFEDFLRRSANSVNVNVEKQNGIGQIINALYNNKSSTGLLDKKIHSKHTSIGAAIGDIRNMAGHSMEARTMERWTLSSNCGKFYIEMVLSTIKSIYNYIDCGTYDY